MKHQTVDLRPYHAILDRHQDALALFEQLLVEENQKYNLTRITSPQQIRARHFLDSLAGLSILDELSQSQEKPLRILDAGSGAGFPGIVLAVVRPEWRFVSLEATGKKVRFQEKVCSALNLSNVQLFHGRAEALVHEPVFRQNFDAVTARALAPLPILSELTLAFLRQNGLAVFWKSSGVSEEAADAGNAVKQMGAQIDRIINYSIPDIEETIGFSLVVCRKLRSTPKSYPRAFGLIKKQPLK